MPQPCVAPGPSIDTLVGQLPDSYQKVFGHPEYDAHAFRDCDDRWRLIESVLDAHPRAAAPLRILDIGCSLGYFALRAAARGCRVTAIDTSAPNIALCRALAAENGLDVDFRLCAFDEGFVTALPDGAYDVTFGLSVFQHLCHEGGAPRCINLIATLARKTRCLITELAVRREPVYWAGSLPEDPETLIGAFPFRTRLGCNPTHLSAVARPMYFASGSACLVDGRLFSFDRVQTHSHEYVGDLHRGSRRYFFGGQVCVKQYRLTSVLAEANRTEFENEIATLTRPGRAGWMPGLLAHDADDEVLCLARELVPGVLLSTLIATHVSFDPWRIVADVLDQLVDLEEEGLHHNDLRSWNVVIGTDGRARLIDFGAISTERTEDVFEAFVTFCYCVANATQPTSPDVLTLRRSAGWFPEDWRPWILAVTAEPESAVSFARIRELLVSRGEEDAGLQARANASNIKRLEAATNRLLEAFPPSQISARHWHETMTEWDRIIRRIQARQQELAERP